MDTDTVAARSAAPDTSRLIDRIRRGVIGEGETLDGPYGRRRITYADCTASGRSLDFVEDFLRDHVLPRYANTHTESSAPGCRPLDYARRPGALSATRSAAPTKTW